MTLPGDLDDDRAGEPGATVTWLVQREDVVPRQFLSLSGTWGGAATAEQFSTAEQARLTVCPAGTSGVSVRMHRLVMRVG